MSSEPRRVSHIINDHAYLCSPIQHRRTRNLTLTVVIGPSLGLLLPNTTSLENKLGIILSSKRETLVEMEPRQSISRGRPRIGGNLAQNRQREERNS